MPKSRLQWEYTEDDMAEAILDITDHGLSPPQAAQRRGVPRTTLIDRLNGRGAAEDQIQPRRRLSKNQEDRLAFWILRQESLGYAPSHSQIPACVMGLLRQQGEHPDLGRNWVIKFINRRADLKTKMGRRQEAKRFDSFTPKAVHWYFDIRDGQYGWIKPENTVNVDEGGIMTGFGSCWKHGPEAQGFLKGSQTRNWTSFIEAVTADGRALVPGIIFKGKELQKQWFLEEFKQIADWYYITSPNGWTDDHIGIEWLERVYLPQTTPADESDARLIILDGHGSHATDEWMAMSFLNNVYCCYLPARCSHGLQPLDNGVFNALKAAHRRELEKFASLTDCAPMDKVNFIRAYAKARRVGMTKKNILSGWRVTGNWPISHSKALRHPEIQQDRPNSGPRVTPEPRPYLGSDDTPQTSRQIRDLGLNKTPKTRRRYNVIAKGFEAQQQTVAAHTLRIASLEEELARLKRGKKRKAVPNPNKRFMTLGETLAGGEAIVEEEPQDMPVGVESVSLSEQESESEAGSVIEDFQSNSLNPEDKGDSRIFQHLTATLLPSEVERFFELAKLSANRVKIFRSRTSRSNIQYRVIEVQPRPRHQRQGVSNSRSSNSDSSGRPVGSEQEAEDIHTVKTVRDWLHQHNNGRVIVYASTIDRVERLAKMWECNMYHSKVDTAAGKVQRLRSWIDDGHLIVATNSLGLGVDVSDVRLVIHAGMPSRLRDYVQESGRAGRDGGQSEAVVVTCRPRPENKSGKKTTASGKSSWPPKEAAVERLIRGKWCCRVMLDQVMDGRFDRMGCDEETEEAWDRCRRQMDQLMFEDNISWVEREGDCTQGDMDRKTVIMASGGREVMDDGGRARFE
ncbi:hypothetical protein FOXG_21712 [Fusarium oxysporum f. sp. lycopersici 4287]|uniref:DNA 3'-5' helicase n=1 Tax=Fusarium oxysporum f. sp. lycopersici (strain 4287 / CBS 123668 / FGSC 9935 / NRRL 34936) TaxID=426428 RepID=A0A0J9W0L7_FUSO4|nr:hypothetical protein FOXG_21712 [Fusarium oxysporum f. sp. lycopersici 4287]KNB16583.1 hypothetical protein FOXG_21712 [Fusarium oxysporum f. sp. lycopersici 4287]